MKLKRSFLQIVCCLAIGWVAVFVNGCAIFNAISQGDASGLMSNISNATSSIKNATEAITPSQEYYIGRAVAANLLSRYELSSDTRRTNYLNKICMALVINSDKPEIYGGYHVGILKTSEINAFATSGGHILITEGLLECTDSEDAIAAVLAHEIAHIQEKHGIASIKSSRTLNAIVSTANVLTDTGSQNSALLVAFNEGIEDVLDTLVTSGYSQSQEYDADKLALGLLHKAGYNPYAMVDMLNLLDEKLGSANTGFGKTHPTAKNRLKKVQSNLSKNYPANDHKLITIRY